MQKALNNFKLVKRYKDYTDTTYVACSKCVFLDSENNCDFIKRRIPVLCSLSDPSYFELVHKLTDQAIDPKELYDLYKLQYNKEVLAKGLVGATVS